MIVNYDDVRINLKEIEAISEIKYHELDMRILWIGEIYKYWEYKLYSKSGIVYNNTCEKDELERFKNHHENILDAWETLNEK